MKKYFILLLLLSSCGTDPVAGDFAAPKLGEVTVEMEAFRAWISCPVSGNLSGVSNYAIRFGDVLLKEVPASLENGVLKAEVKALRADTDYSIEVSLSNGAETLAKTVSFRTESGPATVEMPDPVFQRYILAHFDPNGDEVLTIPEAQAITEIVVCTDSIYSLQGIEKMSRLIRLEAQASEGHRGKLFEIDLSGNPWLETCLLNDNFLSTLDLSGLPNLQVLCFAANPLETIDFSHNPLLTELYMNNIPLRELPEMRPLSLTSLHMEHVARFLPEDYLRNFPLLYSVNVAFFEGRTLDLSQNRQLDALWAYGCPNLEELDLTATANLRMLYVGDCPKLRRVLVRAGTRFTELEKEDYTEIVYVE